MRFSVPSGEEGGGRRARADMRSYLKSVTERCSKVLQSFLHLPVLLFRSSDIL